MPESAGSKLARLGDALQYCNICERMCHRARVLSAASGNPDAKVMFIAEAPGRLGADRTGVPLHGDRTGDNFETLLGTIGWRREDVFVTNALLCNPRDEAGNNATPTKEELANCSLNLQMTIGLVDPEVVVTLGLAALTSVGLIAPHRLELREAVGNPTHWNGRTLVPLYHPGPRALIHRNMLRQTTDFMELSRLIDPAKGLKKRRGERRQTLVEELGDALTPVQELADVIVRGLNEVSMFKLTKLLYLVDLNAWQAHGTTATGGTYLRMQEGPWLPNLDSSLSQLSGFEVNRFFRGRKPYVSQGPSPRVEAHPEPWVLDVVADVLERHGRKSDAEIKTAVYLTEPMRAVIRAERQGVRTDRTAVLGPRGPYDSLG